MNELWDFASGCYRQPGVAETCLRWQDTAGADINMLLTAAWLAARKQHWQRSQVIELIALSAEWRSQCLLPLRAVRRYLRDSGDTHLYARIKEAELNAEAYQLRLLEQAMPPAIAGETASGGTHAETLEWNLRLYAEQLADARAIGDFDRELTALATLLGAGLSSPEPNPSTDK